METIEIIETEIAKQYLKQTLAIAEKFIHSEKETPVTPYKSPQDFSDELDIEIQREKLSEKAFFDLLRQVVFNTPKTSSPAFFNQLFGGRNLPALSGEILAAVLNNSMYTFKVAGIQVLLEKAVLQKMCQKVGYKAGNGTIVSGGSMANLTALLVARNEAQTHIRNKGFQGEKLIVYSSEDGHYSIKKNAGILGLGRDNVRLIKTNDKGEMLVADLQRQIEQDIKNGNIPFFINATAGTTVIGAFDPLDEIAQIAERYKIWFHIDAALGGGVLLSRKYKHLLRGSELSDSFTWNAHKMMGIPLTASIILLKDASMLRRNLSEKADYLFQSEEDYNPGEESLQCGRRNDALKIWSAWKYYGDEGYEERVNRQYDLTHYAVEVIRGDEDLDLLVEPACLTVCFNVRGKSPQDICTELDQRSLIKVGYGKVKGVYCIRVVFMNPSFKFSDIDNFFEQVKNIATQL